jgi:methylmalonyl-CoA/ethylmalonyl-CoA epimerase
MSWEEPTYVLYYDQTPADYSTFDRKFLFDAGTMAFFQCGTVRLRIVLAEKRLTPEGTTFYYRVSGIEHGYVSLKEKGMEFLQEPHLVAKMPNHDLWMAFLKDSAATPLSL